MDDPGVQFAKRLYESTALEQAGKGFSCYVRSPDGLMLKVMCCINNPTPPSKSINLAIGIPTSDTNKRMQLNDVLFSHNFWWVGSACGDEDCGCSNTIQTADAVISYSHISNTDDVAFFKAVYNAVARAAAMTLCACREFFITDAAPECFNCQLAKTRDPAARSERGRCCVCMEPVVTKDVTRCCQQPLHPACLAQSVETSASNTCPLCRGNASAKRVKT